VLPWSPKSPDLSPIEHLWDDLNRRVCSRQPALQTLQELQQDLEQEWGEIPQDCIRRLSLCRDGSVLCYRLMVGTTDIDFEVTSSERYGL
jgi:hypothetical protein